ncbi:MAG: ATPase [Pseudomonadota bacterium]
MIYESAEAWRRAPARRILFFGMSGLGKTHVSSLLRRSGNWFHYSVDYRIGTRYMGEYIADNFKAEAMKVPFLADLLKSDSIYVGSNITFDNLSPLSTYLGKPGDPAKGGLPIAEYRRRQGRHRTAEIAAMHDTAEFIDRAKTLYGYDHFVCDASGSLCEVVNPEDPEDPVLSALAENLLLVWIEGTEAHTAELVRRFDADPKPMCYQETFLDTAWATYLTETGQSETEVDPDAFIRWTFARALAHRQPRYRSMAERWGLTLRAEDVARITSEADLLAIIARALPGQS